MGTIDARLATLDASLEDWQELISTSLRFATNCARIYRRAGDSRRKEFNTAVLEEVLVRDGHVVNAAYQAPFDLLFAMPKFEYEDVVEAKGLEPSNLLTASQFLPILGRITDSRSPCSGHLFGECSG
jgi:hypothetical protein